MTDKKLSALSSGTAIADADLFYSAQGGGQVKQPASALRMYVLGGGGVRIFLTADLNLYVSPSGSDTTGNGSIGNPWQSLQHAIDYVKSSIDMGAWAVLINMANGTYGSVAITSIIGAIGLIAAGAVTISGSGFALIYVFNADVTLTGGGTFTFTNSTAGQTALFADTACVLQALTGTTLQFTAGATDTIHCIAQHGGFIDLLGNVSITGNFGSHLYANEGGSIQRDVGTTTFVSSPTAGVAFAVADTNGNISIVATQTFTGTMLGQKYSVTLNGTIQSFAQTLPGTGFTQSTGGQFA